MPSKFEKFRPYLRGLVRMAADPASTDREDWLERVEVVLNGQAGDELQARVDAATRRKHGTFFTGHKLAHRLVRGIDEKDLRHAIVGDPSVGASDLLIAMARRIGPAKNYTSTLEQWSARLFGLDLHPEFIETSKARLVLLARSLHDRFDGEPVNWNAVFPNIRKGDALADLEIYDVATHLVMNPPFSKMDAPADCAWANGKVNAAAVFMETTVKNARPGTKILAILPEVLRTGTRYEKWQKMITMHADVVNADSEGLFHNADVDVFSLVLRKKTKSASTGKSFLIGRKGKEQRLGDLFKVSVGAVVPYRDPKKGPTYRYLHPKNARPWATLKRLTEPRRFSGTVVTPPFVAIRRTSRPGDKRRATASLVLGRLPVAVENHMIVCKPSDGRIASCERLMEILNTSRVDVFLDRQMRCRHLTVSVVANIPIARTN